MNYTLLGIANIVAISMAMGAPLAKNASETIWTNKPANTEDKNWEREGYPIGNGRIGAMIFAQPTHERYALNEISLWSGGENPGGGYGYGPDTDKNGFGAYQPFGDLLVDIEGDSSVTDFVRALDVKTGIHTTSFEKDGVKYTRKAFSSAPQQVMILEYKASEPKKLSAKFAFAGKHSGTEVSAKNNQLFLKGQLKNGEEFAGKAVIVQKGGSLKSEGNAVEVKDADSIVVYVALATDYVMDHKKNWKNNVSPSVIVDKQLSAAGKASLDQIEKAHLADMKKYLNRVEIDLGKTADDIAGLPIDERLKRYSDAVKKGEKPNDPDLEELLFNTGRYLLLSSSRQGNLPANLQGMWNDKVSPPWACDYHNNINFQMAYWGATVTNLLESHDAMLDYIFAMAPVCAETTQKNFKNEDGTTPRGWTVRTSQNIWGGNGWDWNIPGSAWYATHAWAQYLFNQDKKYLATKAYPMMKEVCHFWEDHLKELGENGAGFKSGDQNAINTPEVKSLKKGTLVAPHGWSPEHGPREDGVMHDQQLIRELFDNTLVAAKIVGEKDTAWLKSLKDKRDRLAPNMISKNGYLQEWIVDRPNNITGHRHTSHLYAVYPGSEISKVKTPELAQAALKSLELRGTSGDNHRSWVWPWRTALYARFGEGDKAHQMLSSLLTYNILPNMLTTHPPMQMDGNFGAPAGMSEMLLQSHAGEIALLPAPTSEWKDGSVKGLRARGNIVVNFDWKDGKVTNYELISPDSKTVKVRVNGKLEKATTKAPSKPKAKQ